MRKKAVWQAVKFTLFSISAGIIQVVSFALLHDVLGLESYWMSHVPSLILSVLWNFTFNRRYTFRSDASLTRSMALVALYYVVFTPASGWWGTALSEAGVHDWLVALYYVVFTPASGWWGTALSEAGVHDWLVEAMNLLINFVTEFLFQRFVVYRTSLDTNEVAKRAQEQGKL